MLETTHAPSRGGTARGRARRLLDVLAPYLEKQAFGGKDADPDEQVTKWKAAVRRPLGSRGARKPEDNVSASRSA